MLRLCHAARRGHQQGPGKISRGFIQYIRRISRHHTGRSGCGDIDVVVTHGHIADSFQTGIAVDEISRDAVTGIGEHALLALQATYQFSFAVHHIVLIGFKIKML